MKKKHDIQKLIGNTLRWGVSLACAIAFLAGVYFLFQHGSEPMPDYSEFRGGHQSYTTLGGIIGGAVGMNARSWIQIGVLALILTPIMRVALSLVDFVEDRDWLYAAITAVVLSVILANSVGGVVP